MTRKLFIFSFAFAIISGILIVLTQIFLSNYPKLIICIYLLIGISVLYISLRFFNSKSESNSKFIFFAFILFIIMPFLPIITYEYNGFNKKKESHFSGKNDTATPLQIVPNNNAASDKKFYIIYYEKITSVIEKFINSKNFSRTSETLFNNYFPFRENIGRKYNYYAVKYLRKSSNDKVIIGKDGWLFYKGDDGKQTIDDYTGKQRFSEDELESIRTILEKYSTNLSSMGIKFIIVVAPSKEFIYSEYLPDFYFKDKTSKLEQVKKYLLKKHSSIEFIDLKEVFLNEKNNKNRKYPLFFRTDTHWNDSGAYVGYHQILRRINMVPIDENQFIQRELIHSGDIVKTMLNCYGLINENSVYYEPKIIRSAKRIDKNDTDFITTNNNSKLPTAVFYCDSFGGAIQPFISEHFSRIEWIWTFKIDMKLIEEEKPDYVVVEMVERNLYNILKL